jgi:hypothetical protein
MYNSTVFKWKKKENIDAECLLDGERVREREREREQKQANEEERSET